MADHTHPEFRRFERMEEMLEAGGKFVVTPVLDAHIMGLRNEIKSVAEDVIEIKKQSSSTRNIVFTALFGGLVSFGMGIVMFFLTRTP